MTARSAGRSNRSTPFGQDQHDCGTGVSAGLGRFGAILWVKPGDVKKAAKVFGIGLR